MKTFSLTAAWAALGAIGVGIWNGIQLARKFNDEHMRWTIPGYVWVLASIAIGIGTCVTSHENVLPANVPTLYGQILTGFAAGALSAITHKGVKFVAAASAARAASTSALTGNTTVPPWVGIEPAPAIVPDAQSGDEVLG